MISIIKVHKNRVAVYQDFKSRLDAEAHTEKYGGFVYDGDYRPDLFVDDTSVTIVPIEPTAEELKRREAEASRAEAKADSVTRYCATHTPAEIKDWVASRLPSLTAPETAFIARLCVALGVLYRDQ